MPSGRAARCGVCHWANEELLVVVAGTPTLRSPAGERRLEPGETVLCPRGPEGAHQVRNDGPEPARVLIVSANRVPSISMYPDSDKIGARPGVEEDTLNFPRAAAVDYWEGED